MSYRNKKLVITNSQDDIGNPEDESTKDNSQPTKRERQENTTPRRSKRLRKKSSEDFIENPPSSEPSTSDSSSSESEEYAEGEERDDEPLLIEMITKHASSLDEASVNNIIDILLFESWFLKLSENEKIRYILKIVELEKYENLPTIKDIIDLGIDREDIKDLISKRLDLNEYDKLTPEYDNACREFIKEFRQLSDKEMIKKKGEMKEQEKRLLHHLKLTEPIKSRILLSNYDEKTKAVIYDRYHQMLGLSVEDAGKYRTWIETVLSLPQHPKKLNIDDSLPPNEAISKLLVDFRNKLDQRVYGMIHAKEELICIVANMIVNSKSKNKAIGLCGPPGIGKTLIARTLAEVLGLNMEQISLGGVTDPAFLEGHGFTYIGSEPGCIVKALIRNGCTNGFIYFDEVDKITKSEAKGKDIESCLLHITDFTQNHDFRDKYMPEIPVDLSNCFFIYSMNSVDEFDSAMLSRIPLIKFSGYNFKEKIAIVHDYLLPELLNNYSLCSSDLIIPTEVVEYLIKNVKEVDEIDGRSGVREVKKVLDKILNRINLHKVASVNQQLVVGVSFQIKDFKLPYQLTIEFVDNVLRSLGSEKYQDKYLTLYT